MAECDLNEVVAGLPLSCRASKKQGGIKKLVWIGNYDDVATTVDNDGYLFANMAGSPTGHLFQFEGKDFKHNGTLTGVIGENVNIIQQALNLVLYYFTPAEREAIESLFNAEKLIVFVEGNGGEGKAPIDVYGVSNGLKASALTGGTGTALQDSTAVTVTLTGDEVGFPKVLKLGTLNPDEVGYLAENIEILNTYSAT